LLAHELAHVVQQERVADAETAEISVGPADDLFERAAERAADLVMAAEPDGLPANDAPRALGSVDTPTVQRVAVKACGPKVDTQVRDVWTKIGTDFKSWNEKDALKACSYLLSPFVTDQTLLPGEKRKVDVPLIGPFGRSGTVKTTLNWNVDAFDTLPLFYFGAINWLMNPALLARGCCSPPISETEAQVSDPDARSANQEKCEARDTCCSTVQIGNKCWLSGTVNYGTYGIMVGLCRNRFPIRYRDIYYIARAEAYAYKKLGSRQRFGGATTKEVDLSEPLSWY
jgi:hypothetical protein